MHFLPSYMWGNKLSPCLSSHEKCKTPGIWAGASHTRRFKRHMEKDGLNSQENNETLCLSIWAQARSWVDHSSSRGSWEVMRVNRNILNVQEIKGILMINRKSLALGKVHTHTKKFHSKHKTVRKYKFWNIIIKRWDVHKSIWVHWTWV